jgi:hypothetical protein
LTQDKRKPAAIESARVTGPAPGSPVSETIAGRLFVAGCPRSGTTLVQSLLAAHPAVLSFPETAVFGRLLGLDPLPGEARLDTVHRRTQLAYRLTMTLLHSLGRGDLEPILPVRSQSIPQFVAGFVGVLDRLTLDKGKSWWVEKTPRNILLAPEILELVPAAKFICILRDGRQNVAALYDMACKYPERGWAKFRDLDFAIALWNTCARQVGLLLDKPDVLVIRYERLQSDTETVAREMCRFAGLPFTHQMIDRRIEAASAVIAAH